MYICIYTYHHIWYFLILHMYIICIYIYISMTARWWHQKYRSDSSCIIDGNWKWWDNFRTMMEFFWEHWWKQTLDSLNGTHLVAQTLTSVSSLDDTWQPGDPRVQLGNCRLRKVSGSTKVNEPFNEHDFWLLQFGKNTGMWEQLPERAEMRGHRVPFFQNFQSSASSWS
jgi:hypothetical protein